MQRLSLYAENLPPDAKTRYLAKISIIDGTDPLSDGVFGEEVDITPPVDACDLVSYLVLQTIIIIIIIIIIANLTCMSIMQ